MRIDFKSNGWDAHVIMLAKKGLSARAIADRVGMSINQVRTRLAKKGVHITDYRNGISSESRKAMEEARRTLYETYSTLRMPNHV